jgi:hypothetical protein
VRLSNICRTAPPKRYAVAAFGAAKLHFAPIHVNSSHPFHLFPRLRQSGIYLTDLTEHTMLIQILTQTPVYVWAILALLVYRGMVALRDRKVEIKKLFIIPVIMVALSLHDIATKFGFGVLPFSAWAAGVVGMSMLVWKFSNAGIAVCGTPGSVLVRGSWAPMAMMMAIFFTKYITAVTLVMQPHASQNALFAAAVCTTFGVFNGCFLGRLARDMTHYEAGQEEGQASCAVARAA